MEKITALNNATTEINAAVLTELKKISTQNTATFDINAANADTNAAVSTELIKISSQNNATFAVVLTELMKVVDSNKAPNYIASKNRFTHKILRV